MLRTLPELLIAPILVACSTVAARRWGARMGGLVSAFPAVVGPLLLITAHDRGVDFTARAANGVLLGLAALSAFALTYARLAVRTRWTVSFTAGWVFAAAAAALVGWLGRGLWFPGGLVVAAISLLLARAAMPGSEAPRTLASADSTTSRLRRDVLLRMALTAALVALLAAAAELFGSLVGGMLAALPVLASVLAVFTHRQEGSRAVVALLRGMLSGMAAFTGFCTVVALLIVPAGTVAAFAAATAVALGLQAIVIRAGASQQPEASRYPEASRHPEKALFGA